MARGAYTETVALRALRQLVAFADDRRTTPSELARVGRAYIVPAAQERLRTLSVDEVIALKQELRTFLGDMAFNHDGQPPKVPAEHRFQVTLVTAGGPYGIVLFADGDPRAVLLYQVTTVLQAVGTDRLRRCPAHDCGRPFIKRGRREYCSTECQRRMYLKSYDPFQARPRRKDAHGKKTRKG